MTKFNSSDDTTRQPFYYRVEIQLIVLKVFYLLRFLIFFFDDASSSCFILGLHELQVLLYDVYCTLHHTPNL